MLSPFCSHPVPCRWPFGPEWRLCAGPPSISIQSRQREYDVVLPFFVIGSTGRASQGRFIRSFRQECTIDIGGGTLKACPGLMPCSDATAQAIGIAPTVFTAVFEWGFDAQKQYYLSTQTNLGSSIPLIRNLGYYGQIVNPAGCAWCLYDGGASQLTIYDPPNFGFDGLWYVHIADNLPSHCGTFQGGWDYAESTINTTVRASAVFSPPTGGQTDLAVEAHSSFALLEAYPAEYDYDIYKAQGVPHLVFDDHVGYCAPSVTEAKGLFGFAGSWNVADTIGANSLSADTGSDAAYIRPEGDYVVAESRLTVAPAGIDDRGRILRVRPVWADRRAECFNDHPVFAGAEGEEIVGDWQQLTLSMHNPVQSDWVATPEAPGRWRYLKRYEVEEGGS